MFISRCFQVVFEFTILRVCRVDLQQLADVVVAQVVLNTNLGVWLVLASVLALVPHFSSIFHHHSSFVVRPSLRSFLFDRQSVARCQFLFALCTLLLVPCVFVCVICSLLCCSSHLVLCSLLLTHVFLVVFPLLTCKTIPRFPLLSYFL